MLENGSAADSLRRQSTGFHRLEAYPEPRAGRFCEARQRPGGGRRLSALHPRHRRLCGAHRLGHLLRRAVAMRRHRWRAQRRLALHPHLPKRSFQVFDALPRLRDPETELPTSTILQRSARTTRMFCCGVLELPPLLCQSKRVETRSEVHAAFVPQLSRPHAPHRRRARPARPRHSARA